MTGEQDVRRPRASYEIRIRGHLGATMLRAFPALHAETRDGDTLLRGGIADQAALYGALAQIEAFGLELIEVRRLPREPRPTRITRARDAESPGRTGGLSAAPRDGEERDTAMNAQVKEGAQ